MSVDDDPTKYDEALLSILVNEKSILGFLSSIFNFLARRTDFYYVPQGAYENMGFAPGMAEELVVKMLRKCDPKNSLSDNNNVTSAEVNDAIMCSTVAQEVEIEADNNDTSDIEDATEIEEQNVTNKRSNSEENTDDDFAPPKLPVQINSEAYNGAEREKYSWAQTIMELDATVKLPADIKSAKDLKVTINSGDICVQCRNGDIIIKDTFPYKIKALDSFWSISEGRLLIHLEKHQERWWGSLLSSEEKIDLSKIDCSRNLDELPEEHIAKVRELQWNQEQKFKGLPTSDEMKNLEVLKRAWNAEGSPFKGTEFDPSVLRTN